MQVVAYLLPLPFGIKTTSSISLFLANCNPKVKVESYSSNTHVWFCFTPSVKGIARLTRSHGWTWKSNTLVRHQFVSSWTLSWNKFESNATLTQKITLGRIGCLSCTLLVNFWPQLTSPTLFLFLQAKAHGKTCPVFINCNWSLNNSHPACPHLWSRYLVEGRWASSWRGSPSRERTGGRTWSERCRCSFDLTARGYILREWLFLLPPCKQQVIRKLIVGLEANVFSISLFVITWWLWQRGEHNCTIDSLDHCLSSF